MNWMNVLSLELTQRLFFSNKKKKKKKLVCNSTKFGWLWEKANSVKSIVTWWTWGKMHIVLVYIAIYISIVIVSSIKKIKKSNMYLKCKVPRCIIFARLGPSNRNAATKWGNIRITCISLTRFPTDCRNRPKAAWRHPPRTQWRREWEPLFIIMTQPGVEPTTFRNLAVVLW